MADANTDALSGREIVGSVENVFDKMLAERTSNELWKWFVILALVFLTIELLIQKFVK